MIRGIVFDKDGTLIDLLATWIPTYRAATDALAALVGDPDGSDRLMRAGGWLDDGTLRPGSPLSCSSNEDIIALWCSDPAVAPHPAAADLARTTFLREAVANTAPLLPLAPLLDDLRARGLRLGIATMDSTAAARTSLANLGVLDRFDLVIGYDAGFAVKPDAGMVLAFCEATGLAPHEVAMVGDAVKDLQTGRNAGVGWNVAVLTGVADHDVLADLADAVLPSVASLPVLLDAMAHGPAVPTRAVRGALTPGAAAVHGLTALRFSDGGQPAEDVPGHVRAASAVRRRGDELLVVQDDSHVVAVVRAHGGVDGLLLPRGEGGRRIFDDTLGNKHAKHDLEAAFVAPDGRLIALGSGSTRRRERVVIVDVDGRVTSRPAGDLYAALRAVPSLTGAGLNLEGAVLDGDTLTLVQRGNDAPSPGRPPVDALGSFSAAAFFAWLDDGGPPPLPRAVVQLTLPSVADVRATLTDATALPDGALLLLAAAEASPDAVRDGEVVGVLVAVWDGTSLRAAPVVGADGAPLTAKLEGVERLADGRFVVVADLDDPGQPALIGELTLPPHLLEDP